MKKVTIFLFIVIMTMECLLLCSERPEETWELFWEANNAYRKHDYRKAVDLYEKLLSCGLKSGNIYYNLGNAYFRRGMLGKAIVNYERAKYLMPRDPDLDFNIRLVKEKTRDMIEPASRFLQQLFSWLDWFTLSEVFWFFAVINCTMWILLLLNLARTRACNRLITRAVLSIWVFSAVALSLKLYKTTHDYRAVIIVKELDVRAGPEKSDTVLFKLHDGAMVKIGKPYGKWQVIRLSDGRRGWVTKNALEQIHQFAVN